MEMRGWEIDASTLPAIVSTAPHSHHSGVTKSCPFRRDNGDKFHHHIMKIKYLIVIPMALVLTTACGVGSDPTIELNVPVASTSTEVQEKVEPVVETLVPSETLPPIVPTTLPDGTDVTNCLGNEISPIGRSIADDYDSATYEQVMTWFCNGAEFEDILVALETEEQTDVSAEEMLKMLADGFTWDEIWQIIGLTD